VTKITITIEGPTEAFVKRFAEERGLSPEAAALELIRRSAGVEEMNALRDRLRPYFEKASIESDEDVQRLVDEARETPRGA